MNKGWRIALLVFLSGLNLIIGILSNSGFAYFSSGFCCAVALVVAWKQ
jgi:hypothetical protein